MALSEPGPIAAEHMATTESARSWPDHRLANFEAEVEASFGAQVLDAMEPGYSHFANATNCLKGIEPPAPLRVRHPAFPKDRRDCARQ
jgi:hypothetical protein